ncbi:uncharacterized protein LOC125070653 [Vanessa atalanta]|uniref:uncharacterized protein LOC125070653 n=1 Tax=Vanessa atalanta TaxID=42275 RepID=UPI001FCDCE28|nr:uncharacterized protein LOC125070653 [Vanessa atalanta]
MFKSLFKSKKRVKQGIIRPKKKRTCCQRCRRKILKWCCRRIKRCIKKKVFGIPPPKLRDNLKLNKSQDALNKDTEKLSIKKPVIELFRNYLYKSTKSIPMKNAFIDEIDKYFEPLSIGNRLKSFVSDFKERNLSLDFKNFSLTNLEFLRNINSDELKKQFSLTASKHKMLGNMIEDYKKGKISLTALQSDLKNDKKILNKENLNQMLKYYKEQKSKHQPIVKQSKFKQLKSDLRAKIDFL